MSVDDFHNKAMDSAECAFLARLHGQREQAHDFFVQALKYELAAIAQLETEGPVEPTYSVLHRSAGTLALDCNQPEKADEIVKKALNQNPHPEIAEELHELQHEIYLVLSPLLSHNGLIDEDIRDNSNSSKSVRTLKEAA